MAAGVLRVRSSSSMWSSLRSISSRRRRISERLSSEVMTSQHRRKQAPAGGDGGHARPGPQLAERIELGLFTLRRWEKCAGFFASPTSPSGRYRLVALPTPGDLLICAKDLFVDATTVCRDAAGVHYRSDSARGLFVGERSGSCATIAALTTSASTASS